MNDLDKIRKMLDMARVQVDELEITERVLSRLHGLEAPAETSSPMFTLRRTVTAAPAALPEPAKKGNAEKKGPPLAPITQTILEIIRDRAPVHRDDIIAQLGARRPEDRQHAIKTLANLRSRKMVTMDGLKQYHFGEVKTKARKIAPPDKKRAEQERQQVLDVINKAGHALTSNEVVKGVLGPDPDKNARDRLYWAMKQLRDKGKVVYANNAYTPARQASAA
jgi:hypothetical protein